MDKFKKLLQRHLDKTATEEESEEFFALLVTGEFDHLVTPEMFEAFRSKREVSIMEKNSLEKVYSQFHSNTGKQPAKIVHFQRSRVWLAAAAIFAFAAVATVLIKKKDVFFKEPLFGQQAVKPSVYTGKQVIYMPDGTNVILNENSELSYDQTFGLSSREVFLKGEAFFDVMHDPSRPFIVRTGTVNTQVLGTAFNINAYPEQHKIIVTVIRGLVQVGDDHRIYGKISPDEQIEVNITSNDFVKRNAKAEEALAWQKDFIILHHVTLAQAAQTLGEKFKVQITFENESLKKCRYYGAFLSNESLEDILAIMSTVIQIKYTIEKRGHVILRGKGCD